MKLTTASLSDAQEIKDLLNRSYRSSEGWTNESRLITGDRTSLSDIQETIKDINSHFFIYRKNYTLIACICLKHNKEDVHIGSFAVNPDYQSSGIGKCMLEAAESFAITTLGAKKFEMLVLSDRTELISYYERRGYARSGEKREYPLHLNVGTPIQANITIEPLYKYPHKHK